MLRLSTADWDQSSLNLARYSAVAFGMCMLAILSGVHRLWVERHLTPLTVVWFLFGFLMFASAIVNSSASEAFGGLWCLAGVPVVCFAAIPRIIRRYGLSILPITIILGDLPYIAASLFQYPLQYPYMGVTGNPNSLGVLAATMGCAFLALASAAKSRRTALRLLIGWLGCFFLVLLSGSRTSAIALLATTALFFADLLASAISWARKSALVTVILLLALCCLQLTTPEGSASIVYEILNKSDQVRGTFQPQRSEIWSQTLSDATLLGHGADYFVDRFTFGGHNSIISVCGQYGIVPAVFLVVFGVGGMASAWRYYRTQRIWTEHALTPLLFQVCFWTLSVGEGMFGLVAGSINLAFLVSFGLTRDCPRSPGVILAVRVPARMPDRGCAFGPGNTASM
ncbi:MAG: hypothetical protein ABSC05_07685 [Candidatus Solibacter sp.]